MTIKARFVHINLVAEDWEALAAFYRGAFGCIAVPPERDLSGEALEAGTGVAGARLRGIHLRLPGQAGDGPTLEIYQYDPPVGHARAAANAPGFRHIAFAVDDVPAAHREVLAAGGQAVGQPVTMVVPGAGRITWCYMADPEGNLIELQAWS
jgi:predicted enzyme related to lactoylglutathione lyase